VTADGIDASGTSVHDFQRSHATTTNSLAVMDIKAKSTGNMAAGFGSAARFIIEDDANTENVVAEIAARRESSDTTAALTFKTGGYERMRIDSSGNVGIGASSPSATLDVNSGAANTAAIFESTDAAVDLFLVDTGGNTRIRNQSGSFIVNTGGDASAITGGSEAMRIDSSGNVGIGVTPESWSTTGVVQVGRVSLTGQADAIGSNLNWNAYYNSGWKYKDSLEAGMLYLNNGVFRFKIASSGTADNAITWKTGLNIANNCDISFYEDTGTTAKFFWDASAESLGIGTSSPSAQVHINAVTQNKDGLYVYKSSDEANSAIVVKHDTSSDSRIIADFQNASGSVMKVLGGGNVGIGTSSPATYGGKVNICDGAVGGETNLVVANNNVNQFIRMGIKDNVAQITWDDGDSIAFGENTNSTSSGITTERMRIDSSGNVLVGTTTASGNKFKVERTDNDNAIAEFKTNNASGDVIIRSSGGYARVRATGTNELAFLNAGTEAMRITSSGNVGIGISSPYSTLDVKTTANSGSSALSAYGIRLEAIGAADETIVPITAGFVSSQDRARAGIGFIAKDIDGATGYGGEIGFYTRGSVDGNVLTKSDEKMRIDFSGNVGIGTSSPAETLHVKTAGSSTTYVTGVKIENDQDLSGENVGISFGSTSWPDGAAIYAVDKSSDGKCDLAFACRVGGAPTERMRILSSGGITFNGDTAAANALDDYEEGTWTPAMNGYSGTNNVQVGNYVIIGGMCYFNIQLGFNGSDGSIVSITLPVTSKNLGTVTGGGYMTYNDYVSGASNLEHTTSYVNSNSSILHVAINNNTNQTYNGLGAANGQCYYYFSGQYQV